MRVHNDYMKSLYNESLALLTDLYQLTMAYGYWQNGRADEEAVFNLTFRHNPFQGGYAIAAGLEPVINLIERFRFEAGDIEYLALLQGSDGRALFDEGFLEYLNNIHFSCDIDAIPEGTAVFPHEPLIRVRGPILQCQLLETPLLNLINFQTLIATKSARVVYAAGSDPVLEFGLRRAHGIDGALSASRAAYIGGCHATSNALAGKIFGIPVRGTHAHSWVMSYDDELEAFEKFARAMPNNAVFLVDTYNTLEGVKNACEVGRWLRAKGQRFLGIRLDSGDINSLSQESRRILDEAGFPDAQIFASNDLDEELIQSLKEKGAKVDIWGVGTHLVTGYGQSALGGVYKLSALRRKSGEWAYKLKLSEEEEKISNPGVLQVRRYFTTDEFFCDTIFDPGLCAEPSVMVMSDSKKMLEISPALRHEDLLTPIFRAGKKVYRVPDLSEVRERSLNQISMLQSEIKRFNKPNAYPVGLERNLHKLKMELVASRRGK